AGPRWRRRSSRRARKTGTAPTRTSPLVLRRPHGPPLTLSTNDAASIGQVPASSASVEECEDGEYSSVRVRSRGYLKLAEDVPDVLLDGAFGDPEHVCNRGVGASLCHQLDDLALPRCHDLHRVWPQRSTDQGDDELRIENDPSFADSRERIEQLVDVGDGVLEQVTDTARSCREELDHLLRFDVAREEQDSDARESATDLDGCAD